MLHYSDFVEKILKRLPEDMLVLLEKDRHITSPIWFDVEKLDCPDNVYCIHKDRKTIEHFFELDEELFPEDMWEDHYSCASDYAEDWIKNEFDKFFGESKIGITKGLGRTGNNPLRWSEKSAIGYDNYGDCTVKMLIEDFDNHYNKLLPVERPIMNDLYELYFPYEIDGVSFKFTLLNGIGLNKRIIPQRPYIEIGKALIININPKI